MEIHGNIPIWMIVFFGDVVVFKELNVHLCFACKLFEKWEEIRPRLGLNTSFVPRVPGRPVSLVGGDQIRSQLNLLLHMSVADVVKTLPSFCKCLHLGIACYNNSFYCA